MPIPLSLYIHFPWCIRKCPYCDFNSHTLRDNLPENAYINRLIADLDRELEKMADRPIHSIFMGGGTPSLFSAESLDNLLQQIKQRVTFTDDIEITLEANPGTVEQQRFMGYFAAGINRISLGIQSLQSDKLKTLGRIHNADEALTAVNAVTQAGFNNFNIDLMHGLPNQTIADALYDLETALAQQPTHLSWYQLTLEPNTLFHAQPPVLPEDDLIWEMQDAGKNKLAEYGFEQYEISAYSRKNFHCRHNENYWLFGDYLGIGAGAHSKITCRATGKISRSWKLKNPRDYLDEKKNFVGEETLLTQEQLPFEFMLNALRLYQPIAIDLFTQRTGLTLQHIENQLSAAQQQGLLTWDENFIVATAHGQKFYNNLVELFL